MNFEVFSTKAELDARLKELEGVALTTITDFNGSVYTLKWTSK